MEGLFKASPSVISIGEVKLISFLVSGGSTSSSGVDVAPPLGGYGGVRRARLVATEPLTLTFASVSERTASPKRAVPTPMVRLASTN